jgi:hypothetical protein
VLKSEPLNLPQISRQSQETRYQERSSERKCERNSSFLLSSKADLMVLGSVAVLFLFAFLPLLSPIQLVLPSRNRRQTNYSSCPPSALARERERVREIERERERERERKREREKECEREREDGRRQKRWRTEAGSLDLDFKISHLRITSTSFKVQCHYVIKKVQL